MIRRLLMFTILVGGCRGRPLLKTWRSRPICCIGLLTPNLGLEASIARKHTVQLFYGLNPWEPSGGKSLKHWVVQPEYRYWFCEAFNGWFLGVHLMGGEFNVGEVDLPFGLFDDLSTHRYEGWYAGGGVTAGYQWPLSRHWNLEASLGVGMTTSGTTSSRAASAARSSSLPMPIFRAYQVGDKCFMCSDIKLWRMKNFRFLLYICMAGMAILPVRRTGPCVWREMRWAWKT